MDKLLKPAEVKKTYFKAAQILHPDKVQRTGDLDQLYIANRCFAAINEAYE